jgi:hypothetical protein
MLNLHKKLQTALERLFFRGKSSRKSEFVAFVFGNIVLMVLLFFVILNNIVYDWTGQFIQWAVAFNWVQFLAV